MRVHTRLWGTLSLQLHDHDGRRSNGDTRVAWTRSLAFPGLRPARRSAAARRCRGGRRCWPATDRSSRKARPKARAARARRRSAKLASAVVGQIGADPVLAPPATLEAEGVPGDAEVGVSGLERALDDRLRGRPGGELLAGNARPRLGCSAKPAHAVRTTISPSRAAGCRHGAGRPARRDRRDEARAPARSWPSPGSASKACSRRARRSRSSPSRARSGAHIATPADGLPLRHLRDARRRAPEQRQRRGMRRLAGTRLRRLLQLGVHAARRETRRRAARGDGRKVRLQPRTRGCPGAARQHAAARLADPGRTRRRLDRDRPGRGAGDAAADADSSAATIADGGHRPAPTFTRRRTARRRAGRQPDRWRAPSGT